MNTAKSIVGVLTVVLSFVLTDIAKASDLQPFSADSKTIAIEVSGDISGYTKTQLTAYITREMQKLAKLYSTGANPHRLKLELTEGMLVENVKDIIEKMFSLKAKGVGFSLDDFGTGYSSLTYLNLRPILGSFSRVTIQLFCGRTLDQG